MEEGKEEKEEEKEMVVGMTVVKMVRDGDDGGVGGKEMMGVHV